MSENVHIFETKPRQPPRHTQASPAQSILVISHLYLNMCSAKEQYLHIMTNCAEESQATEINQWTRHKTYFCLTLWYTDCRFSQAKCCWFVMMKQPACSHTLLNHFKSVTFDRICNCMHNHKHDSWPATWYKTCTDADKRFVKQEHVMVFPPDIRVKVGCTRGMHSAA